MKVIHTIFGDLNLISNFEGDIDLGLDLGNDIGYDIFLDMLLEKESPFPKVKDLTKLQKEVNEQFIKKEDKIVGTVKNVVSNVYELLNEAQLVSRNLVLLKEKLCDEDFPIYVSNDYIIPSELDVLSQITMLIGRIRAETIMQNAILNKLQAG